MNIAFGLTIYTHRLRCVCVCVSDLHEMWVAQIIYADIRLIHLN